MTAHDLQKRLSEDLMTAMRDRDRAATAAIRTLLSALANAEAVPAPRGPYTVVVGRADVPRRALTAESIREIVTREIEEHRRAIAEYQSIGADARRLAEELAVLERYL